MNKRNILLVCIIVLAVSVSACGRKNFEDIQTTEIMSTVQPTETVRETIPGLEYFEGDVNLDDRYDAKETTAPTVVATESKEQAGNATTSKPTEPKPTEPKPTEPKPTEPKPTEPKPTEPKPTESKPTEPKPTESKPTEPKPTETQPTTPKTEKEETEYEKYMEMSGGEQQEFIESFGSMDAFFAWLNKAQAEYDAANPDIPIGNGNIDLEKS